MPSQYEKALYWSQDALLIADANATPRLYNDINMKKWIASRLNKNQTAPIDAVYYFAINIVKSTIWCSKYSLIYQDLAPKARLIFSNESQNVNDQGAIRNQHGRNPLYNAKNPSLCIVFARQSIELLYTRPEKCQNNMNAFRIIQLVAKISVLLLNINHY